ncbi:MAG: hypothetical protein HQL64_04785 [Magnetococcales bacterium]|nr:hypothetical protein [Magnetococcales bacterium]
MKQFSVCLAVAAALLLATPAMAEDTAHKSQPTATDGASKHQQQTKKKEMSPEKFQARKAKQVALLEKLLACFKAANSMPDMKKCRDNDKAERHQSREKAYQERHPKQ